VHEPNDAARDLGNIDHHDSVVTYSHRAGDGGRLVLTRKEKWMTRRGRAAAIVAIGLVMICATAMAQEMNLEKLPPSVVKTVPQSGDLNVDPNLKEISVTFSKEMLDKAWSLVEMSKDSFPTIVGSPKYLDDKRTCVVQVELKPDKTYVIWVNSEKFRNFKDTDKQSALPYLLAFKTGGSAQAK
jgi:RNA polymerase sigma-70 factor (ECF subfamily)